MHGGSSIDNNSAQPGPSAQPGGSDQAEGSDQPADSRQPSGAHELADGRQLEGSYQSSGAHEPRGDHQSEAGRPPVDSHQPAGGRQPGDGHRSGPTMPSADWELAGRRLTRFGIAWAVASVAVIPLFAYATRGSGSGLTFPALVLIGNLLVGMLALGGLLGVLICMVVWIVQTAKLEFGSPATGHWGYWGIVSFAVLFVTAYFPPSGLSADGRLLVAAGERLLGVVLLLAGVMHTRRWVERHADEYISSQAEVPMSIRPTAADWSTDWDPAVEQDIEYRRGR